MNILIVDDERLLLKMMEENVTEALPQADIYAFSNPVKAVDFARTTSIDIAFLDVNMRVMNGLEVAKHLQSFNPEVNIIFCTAYSEYMADAWKLYASGFLMKPILPEDILEVIKHLRYPVEEEKKVTFHCFGNFEVYYNGKPVSFQFQRTKELLAYLVDRDGVDLTTKEIMAGAFEDSISRAYFFQLRGDLIQTFEKLGVSDVLRMSRSHLAIERSKVTCDLFDFLDGRNTRCPKEYMTQYSFGEYRLADLLSYIPPDL